MTDSSVALLYDAGSALFITSRNCDAVLGIPWRAALEIAQQHGVQILTVYRRRRMIPASEMVRAIRAEHDRQRPQLTEQESIEAGAAAILRKIDYELIPQTPAQRAATEERVDAILRKHGYEPGWEPRK